jgi:hypothetical protein
MDDKFNEWWTQHLKQKPIPKGYVILILKNLQGHPEVICLWHKHINDILVNKLKFDHTTHEPCLYFQHHPEHSLILILRQVNGFMISAKTEAIAKTIRDQIPNSIAHAKRTKQLWHHQTIQWNGRPTKLPLCQTEL